MQLGLPLLRKELIEQSSQGRTYGVRFLYALVLYGIIIWKYHDWVGSVPPNSFQLLGQGQILFDELVRWQFWGLYLFLPLITSSAIALEKERDTLSLLFVTKLGGTTILLEKLASRLVAMGSFLLLGLPVASVAYSVGGVDVDSIIKATFVLSLTSLQVAAFSLLCSAWCRTAAAAYLATYLCGAAVLLYGSELLKFVLWWGIVFQIHELPWPGVGPKEREWFVASIVNPESIHYRPLYGPWLLGIDPLGTEELARVAVVQVDDLVRATGWMGPETNMSRRWRQSRDHAAVGSAEARLRVRSVTVTECVVCSVPLAISILVFLGLARYRLWRGMNSASVPILTRLFQAADRWANWLNQNPITSGRMWGSTASDLPDDKPIAWRETRRNSIGTLRNLVRLLLILEVPLLVTLLYRLWVWDGESPLHLLSFAWMPCWCLAVLVVVVTSTGTISSEQSRQTLDVLLTTPMASQEILQQKLAGVRRLIFVVAIPLFTIMAADVARVIMTRPATGPIDRTALRTDYGHEEEPIVTSIGGLIIGGGQTIIENEDDPDLIEENARRRRTDVLTLRFQPVLAIVYLSVLAWLGVQFGMRCRHKTKAVWLTLATVVAFCAVPYVMEWGIVTIWRMWMERLHGPFPAFIPWEWARPVWLMDLNWLSPLRILNPHRYHADFDSDGLKVLGLHLGLYLSLWWFLRFNAIRRFSRLVGRTESA